MRQVRPCPLYARRGAAEAGAKPPSPTGRFIRNARRDYFVPRIGVQSEHYWAPFCVLLSPRICREDSASLIHRTHELAAGECTERWRKSSFDGAGPTTAAELAALPRKWRRQLREVDAALVRTSHYPPSRLAPAEVLTSLVSGAGVKRWVCCRSATVVTFADATTQNLLSTGPARRGAIPHCGEMMNGMQVVEPATPARRSTAACAGARLNCQACAEGWTQPAQVAEPGAELESTAAWKPNVAHPHLGHSHTARR